MGPHPIGLVALEKEEERMLSLSPPYEDTVRRQPSASWKDSSY